MKKILLFAGVALMALAAGLFSQQRLAVATENAAPAAGVQFAYPDVQGQLQNADRWRGKILVINFWASWCGPCLKEIPEFVALQREYADKNVQFIGIAIEDQAPVADYLQRVSVNYPMLVAGDAGSNLARQWGNIINAVPFTVIVNAQGQIVHRQPGELSREQFVKVVTPLLTASSQK